jgi:hypothetical protein
MIVLEDSSNLEVELDTTWGRERAIRYLDCFFLLTNTYSSLKEAIAACRNDLDVGLFSIVVEDKGKKNFTLWCPVPNELIPRG